MKKLLTTAVILGSLYGTVEAASINSPIYMPSNREIIANLNTGYYRTRSDKKGGERLNKGWQANLYGMIGVTDNIAINYDFDYRFFRKNLDTSTGLLAKENDAFDDFSFGVTGRVLNKGVNKVDVILNVGETSNLLNDIRFTTQELILRYGLDLNKYNLAFSGGIKNFNDSRFDSDRTEHRFNYKLALENEIILCDNFTLGLDLSYTRVGRETDGTIFNEIEAYNEYAISTDANYAINDSNYLGAYFTYTRNNLEDLKDYGLNYGLKYTTRF